MVGEAVESYRKIDMNSPAMEDIINLLSANRNAPLKVNDGTCLDADYSIHRGFGLYHQGFAVVIVLASIPLVVFGAASGVDNLRRKYREYRMISSFPDPQVFHEQDGAEHGVQHEDRDRGEKHDRHPAHLEPRAGCVPGEEHGQYHREHRKKRTCEECDQKDQCTAEGNQRVVERGVLGVRARKERRKKGQPAFPCSAGVDRAFMVLFRGRSPAPSYTPRMSRSNLKHPRRAAGDSSLTAAGPRIQNRSMNPFAAEEGRERRP